MDFNKNQVLSITYEQLQELMRTMAEASSKLNPLEQRKLDEEMAKDRRRSMMMVELGKVEEETARNKKNSCSHMRDFRTGDGVPKGSAMGEWLTSGQAYQNGTAMIICQRCQQIWLFRPAPDYYTIILQNGLLKQQPPPDDQCLCIGCLSPKLKCRCDEIAKAQRDARPLAEISVSA
jgi:hypothetical protein